MKKGTIISLATLSFIIVALLFLQTPLMRTTRKIAWDALTAATGRIFKVGSLSVEEGVAEQLQRLQVENIALKSQLRDYAQLRAQIGSTPFDSSRSIQASVLARPIDVFRNQFVVTKGVKDGVTRGAPAVVYGNVLVGFVTELNDHTSVIQLLTHPSTNVTAEVLPTEDDQTAARGLLEGRYYTSLVLTTIPRDADLRPGYAVVTTAKEQIPHGLVIGTIDTITNNENEPYQLASLKLPYDIDRISAVNILGAP